MKSAIYIENGIFQVVLTPEDKFEESLISSLTDKSFETLVTKASFYNCQGGWVRYSQSSDDRSLIIRLREIEKR